MTLRYPIPHDPKLLTATLPARRELQDHQPCLQEHCEGRWHHQAIHWTHLFKEGFTGHKASFTHRKHAHKTTLSSHIWELKDEQTISLADPRTTLNKRNEIVAKWRHRDKVLLKHC